MCAAPLSEKQPTRRTTGDLWNTEVVAQETTVRVPTPVIMVKVEGPFRERERKLWTFLIHAVADELTTKRIHEIPTTEVWRVFRKLDGDNGKTWIWDALNSLSDTKVTFEGVDGGDVRYKGITRLISAVRVDDGEDDKDIIRFEFPEMLIKTLIEPLQYARIRTHFLLSLSGKYSVSLYEILESIANRRNPVITATTTEIRQWLKVPEGKLKLWGNLFNRAIKAAINEINKNPVGCGFTIEYQINRGTRGKVTGMTFIVHKTEERKEFETSIGIRRISNSTSNFIPQFSEIVYRKAQEVAPNKDVLFYEKEWNKWRRDKPEIVDQKARERAFIGFCKKKAMNDS